ncbi:uncharacterized protein MELLADRAFT_101856 [Melampsora larici-populina 98AG31]|uniref:Uncharacterized protein n=1 Tax=Melampsora larici-populina (strain 98AG31 / pathotype 3-4-7) TaxID=747676 RepID=F4R546_MELLP|nr:uncharacterized protein MELLADRAFT_101856 [Melampsora larici-populina 98AG31]EGG11991.1 hypothetical protein MELLADRAFT_101856 [Melampsora larici-populina 98AG31]
MAPQSDKFIKGHDQPLEKKQASPNSEEQEAYQEYLASKEDNTPASPDPEEMEAYQAYLDSQVENIPDIRFSSAEPEEVEAVMDYLKSEMGPSMAEFDQDAPSECGSYDSVTNRRRPFCYAFHGLWESGYCKYCQDTPENRSVEEEKDEADAPEGTQEA